MIGILDADELEDYLELRDHKVAAAIRQSNADVKPTGRRAAVCCPILSVESQ